MKPLVLGVLGSGSGSNFQAILGAIDEGRLAARVAIVMSDNPQARILERARARGIPAELLDCAGHTSRFPLAEQRRAATRLRALGVDLVCLAGFMRIVREPLLEAFPMRIVNIHPSLLPAFPGREAWRQALDAGVPETGCTVHFVDAGTDTGPAILRHPVAVLPGDTPESLHARIRQAEHHLYPEALALIGHAPSPS